MTDHLTITLKKPVELLGETWSSLTVREPTGGELLAVDPFNGVTADIVGVSRVSGVPQAVVRMMPASVLVRSASFIGSTLAVPADFLAVDVLPDELDLPLRQSVTHGDREISILHLREPSGADLEAIDKIKGWARDIASVAAMSGLPREVVEKVLGGDIKRGAIFFESFTAAAPTTGGN